jgi:cell shape-determining protein MreD
MSYYIGIPLMVLLALVEVAFLPYFRIFGLQPNLTLVVLVAWMTVRGQEESLYLIPVAALFLGLLDGSAIGLAFLALAPVAVLHELRGVTLGEGQLPIAIAFTLLATFVYQSIYLAAFAANGQAGDILGAVLRVMVPVSLLNVVVLLPIYWIIQLFSPDVRRAMFA